MRRPTLRPAVGTMRPVALVQAAQATPSIAIGVRLRRARTHTSSSRFMPDDDSDQSGRNAPGAFSNRP